MSRFRNTLTNVVINVDDTKDERYGLGWERLDHDADPEPGPVDPPAPVDYSGLKLKDLKAEIDRRNADRTDADKLPADGAEADLIAVLTTDDESMATPKTS